MGVPKNGRVHGVSYPDVTMGVPKFRRYHGGSHARQADSRGAGCHHEICCQLATRHHADLIKPENFVPDQGLIYT